MFLVIGTIASTSIPYFSKIIINQYQDFSKWKFISFTIFYSFIWMLPKTCLALADIVFFPLINNIIKIINSLFLNHIHDIPLKKYEKLKLGEISSAARRISQSTREYINALVLKIIPSIAKMGVSIFILFSYSKSGIGIIVILILNYFFVYLFLKKYIYSRKIAWNASDKSSALIIDSIMNTSSVRFNREFEDKRISKSFTNEAQKWCATNIDLQILNISRNIFKGLSLMIILPVSAALLKMGLIEIGELIMIKGYILSTFGASKTVFNNCKRLVDASCDIEKVVEILKIEKIKYRYNDIPLKTLEKAPIILDNVSFYNDKNQSLIVDKVSLKINYGDKILISGANGSGKSTLCNLISGLYAPSEGSISIANYEMSQIDKSIVAKKIYYLPQGSNIYLPEGEEKHSFNHKKDLNSKNYEKQIGNFNDNFVPMVSGGEKQLMLLLQLIKYHKGEVAILDESTSNLTLSLEKEFITKISKIIPTIIVISHRKNIYDLFTKCYRIKHKKLELI